MLRSMRKIAKNNYQDHQKKNSACADMVEMSFVDDRRKQNQKCDMCEAFGLAGVKI